MPNLFPSSFLECLDPIYREELSNLFQRIDEIVNEDRLSEELVKLLDDFSSRYLMPKKLWEIRFQEIQSWSDIVKRQILAEYIYHFGHLAKMDQEILNVPNLILNKLRDYTENEFPHASKFSVENICFPYDEMEKRWREYESKTAESLIPRSVLQRYKKIKSLYSKMSSIEDDVEEWLKVLMEAKSHKFVVCNVEYRLNKNLSNKELWKSYINYLKNDRHHKKLLQTYSKYVRFFVEDSETLEEYREYAEKFGPSFVPWKNTKNFEIFDENIFPELVAALTLIEVTPPVSAPTCHFNYETVSAQKFPIQLTLLDYIIKNAKADILFNLFKTCKWFYCNSPIDIVFKFNASTWIEDYGAAYSEKNADYGIRNQMINIGNLNHLHMENQILIANVFSFDFGEKFALSNFMPNIYRCTAKYIIILHQNLSFEELKFLIGHGDVVELTMGVKDLDGNPFNVEDIVPFLPKILKLDLFRTVCSQNISQILCDFSFANKMESFSFGAVNILPDPATFAEFILKNASSTNSSQFSFHTKLVPFELYNLDSDDEFDDDVTAEEKRNFEINVKNIIDKEWCVRRNKPGFKIC